MGLLDRWRRKSEPTSDDEVVPDQKQAVVEDAIRERAYELAFAGFDALDEVTESVLEWFEDDPGPTEERRVHLVREGWERRKWELAGSMDDAPDAYAQLSAAFADLEADGILGRMNFTCCQNCGHAEIGLEEGAGDARGYTFFHQQDTERLGDGDVHLAYGSLRADSRVDADLLAAAEAPDDTEERCTAREQVVARSNELIGAEVVAALRDHGLEVTWDGSVNTRILVAAPTWRKPLPVE